MRRPALTRGRELRRLGAGSLVVLLAGLAVQVAAPAPLSWPAPARQFTFPLTGPQSSLSLAVRAQRVRTQVTVVIGEQQASFLSRAGEAATYRVSLPSQKEAPASVEIDVDPPSSVRFTTTALRRVRRPTLAWESTGPPLRLPPPRLATPSDPVAQASVDETDTYGLRLLGVPVRSAPQVDAADVTTVSHGDRLDATCWAIGDLVSNGFPERPIGAYTSDVWFRVLTPAGPGYLPDARFSRRGGGDRLGLPPCPP